MIENTIVSVGLVTWNSAVSLPECLDSLIGQDYPFIEPIFIDNASTDSSIKIIKSRFPDFLVTQNSQNMGFCHAHNQAIRSSRGKYYLALNPDIVMNHDFITLMTRALEEHPECGSASGKLWQSSEPQVSKIIDTTGLFINRHRRQFLRGHGEEDEGQYDTPGEVFGVDGAAPLYRRVMLEDVKIKDQYFDEQFFAHKEDVDLAWRAKLLGWRCWYTPYANAIHPRSFRPGHRAPIPSEIRLHAVKNRYLMLIKNENKASWRRDALRIIGYDLQILAYILFFERTSLKALRLIREQLPEARAWREEIINRVKVDPDEILSWFA